MGRKLNFRFEGFRPVIPGAPRDNAHFRVISELVDIQTVARGRGIRELARLRNRYGAGRWRKRKGVAWVRLSDGSECKAEIHWYEATGIGRREFKLKKLIDTP